jgi:hypothetical protein
MLEALCGNCGGRAESWEAVYHDPVCPSRVAAQTERALRAEAALREVERMIAAKMSDECCCDSVYERVCAALGSE